MKTTNRAAKFKEKQDRRTTLFNDDFKKGQGHFKKTIAVISLGRKGGGPAYSYEMTRGLIENGCGVILFVSKYSENLGDWLSLKTIHTEVIKTYKGKVSFVVNTLLFRFFKYKRMMKRFRSVKVDACYIPMGHPWDRYVVNSLNNPQKILTIHDPIDHSSNNKDAAMLARAIALLNKGILDKKPDHIVILSKCFFQTIKEKGLVSEDHIHVIPHCIFDYSRARNSFDYFPYDQGKINFLFFGRIDKYKGLDVLASAYNAFSRINKSSSLTIVGSGDFSMYSEKFNSLPNVKVINKWIPDKEVISFFNPKAPLIVVLPYVDATQSGVIPIAMSAGIPIIATNTGGLKEQIEDGRTGFLVEPNDVAALTEKMIEVSLRNNSDIVANAKEYISRFSGRELSKSLIDIVSGKKIDNSL